MLFRTFTMLNRIYKRMVWSMNLVSSWTLVVMMVLIGADIIMRELSRYFGKGIIGIDELTSQMMAILVFLALAACQRSRMHIRIDIFGRLFSPRVAGVFEIVAWVAGFVTFTLVVWRLGSYSWVAYETKAVTLGRGAFLEYPFRFVATFGVGVIAFQYLIDAIQRLSAVVTWKREEV